MREVGGRYVWVCRLGRIWLLATLVALALYLVAGTVEIVYSLSQVELAAGQRVNLVLDWFFCPLLTTVVGALLAAVFYGVAVSGANAARAADSAVDRLQRLESLTEAVHNAADRLVDLAQLSDAAKSLLYRQRETEAMNEVLHEYLMRQDYARAEALTNDIEKRLGQAEQVQAMRREIAGARDTTMEQKVDAAVDRIIRLSDAQDWTQASRQANRLLGMLPSNPKIAALPGLIREARMKHKRSLLQAYDEAVKSGDIDRSISLLRELDTYLSPQEAAALEESARGVFKAKLHNLGVQFAIRVTEQNWPEAVAIGEQIVREYPNTRMAQEVRVKTDTLRQLAAGKRAGP